MVIGFVGGGTGGHFYPLIAVAEELNANDLKTKLYYFGPSPYNKDVLAEHEIEHVYIPAGKLRLYFSLKNFSDMIKGALFGVPIAIWKLYVIYPDVIFSKGGYTSVPVLIAAKILRIPIVIHESDTVPGRAHKVAIKAARYIGVAYDDAAKFFPKEKTALIGIPLRKEVKDIPDDPFTELNIPNDKPLIYVTGGSSGAELINNIVLRSLPQLLPHYRVFHQTGSANIEGMKLSAQSLLEGTGLMSSYYIEGNIPAKMVSSLMTAASLIITRAGSTTLFEIAYHGKPSIVIPIPNDVSRDQRSNAYAYARSGAAIVIEEHNLTQSLFENEINTTLGNKDKLEKMSEAAKGMFVDGAAGKIAHILLSIGIEHES